MNLRKVFFNVAVAAAVAAVTAAGTSYLVLRYAPAGKLAGASGPVAADQARVEGILRDYLTKNPEILVEMTTELDKRQAEEQADAAEKGDLRQCRRDLPLAGGPRCRQSQRGCERGRVLRL